MNRIESGTHRCDGTAISGATGGPATASGVSYQVLFAVYHATQMLEHFTSSGGLEETACFIQMEPRIRANGSHVRWDIQVVRPSRPVQVVEAKLNLTKQDVQEFCERISLHEVRPTPCRFHLTYGTSSPSHLSDLLALVRLATESQDSVHFDSLVHDERRHNSQLLTALGHNAFAWLRHIDVSQNDVRTLAQLIEHATSRLVTASNANELQAFLFERFHNAMQTRETVLIRKLFSEIESRGIRLRTRLTEDMSDVALDILPVLDAMRHCSRPLPLSVAAHACDMDERELTDRLMPYQSSGSISIVDGDIDASQTVRTLAQNQPDRSVERVVLALLPFIRNTNSRQQTLNAIELFEKLNHRPRM